MLNSLFIKAAGLQGSNFMKKKLQHRCFPVNIAKFFRISFFKEHLSWLLLYILGTCSLPHFTPLLCFNKGFLMF